MYYVHTVGTTTVRALRYRNFAKAEKKTTDHVTKGTMNM